MNDYKKLLTAALLALILPGNVLFSQSAGTSGNLLGGGTQGGSGTAENSTGAQAERSADITSRSTRAEGLTAEANAQLALSVANYRVTAGDIYTLAFMAGTSMVQYTIPVDSTYRIRVANMGIIDGAGRTFAQLKAQVETIVTNNYPMSGVQFVLTRPAIFKVYVRGEVSAAKEMTAWGLNRLSSLTTENLTGRTSLRDVTVRSAGGQTRVYDLFKAQREGDLTQDPYLRPDDVITFNRVSRRVTINGAVDRPGAEQLVEGENLKDLIESYGSGFTPTADRARITLIRYVDSPEISGNELFLSEQDVNANYGLQDYDSLTIAAITAERPPVAVDRVERTITLNGAVRRPGTYELLPSENLRELIEVYGGGFTVVADKSRIELVRYTDSLSSSGDRVALAEQDVAENFSLRHYDAVTVNSVARLRPVIFVEGAVNLQRSAEGLESASETSASLTGATRVTVAFNQGETYAALVRRNSYWFTAVSDTQNAYIIREGEYIRINLNPLLYDADFREDVQLVENDTLIIPFRQYFVTVAGAVLAPGRYPYIPDRDWDYYVALSGGFDPGRNSRDTVDIYDIRGKRLQKSDIITPETIITARTNAFLFYFNQYAPVVTTVLTLVTTFLSLQAYLNR
jgi:protein involved in polysaccharide export with SLBB domain